MKLNLRPQARSNHNQKEKENIAQKLSCFYTKEEMEQVEMFLSINGKFIESKEGTLPKEM